MDREILGDIHTQYPYKQYKSTKGQPCPIVDERYGVDDFVRFVGLDTYGDRIAVWDLEAMSRWNGPSVSIGPNSYDLLTILKLEGVVDSDLNLRDLIADAKVNVGGRNLREIIQETDSTTQTNKRVAKAVMRSSYSINFREFLRSRIKTVTFYQGLVRAGSPYSEWWLVFSGSGTGIKNGDPAMPIHLLTEQEYDGIGSDVKSNNRVRNGRQ